ncbi:MAG TPA: sulfotransferase, partial [Acidimicrobiales bacterium]|nr:sulfotransferase [Acidimicrobiales bacterium]
TMLFETMATMPSYHDWYRSTDQTKAYGQLKTTLKVLQWARGPRQARWILKTPQHLEQFGPLMQIFPDATVVVTHRDPVSVTASTATMLSYLARLNTARPDPVRIGQYWSARIETMLDACMRDRHLLPASQSIDVRFDEFMADDVAMVERIYAVADQPFTPSVRDAMAAFMASHPRGRHGRVVYDLADFDLAYEERRAALAGYVERFGVAEEEPGAG